MLKDTRIVFIGAGAMGGAMAGAMSGGAIGGLLAA